MSTAVVLSRFIQHEYFVSLQEVQVWLLSVSSQSLARAPGPASSLPSLSSWVVKGNPCIGERLQLVSIKDIPHFVFLSCSLQS